MFYVIIFSVCYILLVILLFYLFKLTDYIRQFFISLWVLLFCFITYVAVYLVKDPFSFEVVKKLFFMYGKILILLLLLIITCIIVYQIFIKIFLFSVSHNLFITIIISILLLALIHPLIEDQNHPVLNLIKDVIFYVPCLITDLIEYSIKDYNNTPSTTFILFVIIVLFCLMYFLIPLIKPQDGIVIISDPENLNKNIVSLTILDINNKIKNSNLYSNSEINLYSSHVSNVKYKPPQVASFPTDRHSQSSYESFVSVQETDMSPVNNLFRTYPTPPKLINSNVDAPNKKKNKNKNKNKNKKKSILPSAVEKQLNTIYSQFEATIDTLSGSSIFTYVGPYISNYSMTFWLYLNNNNDNNKVEDSILSFGWKLYMKMDHSTKELIIEIVKNDKNDDKGIVSVYKTTEILIQRWNHIVINYSDSKFSLFINNNLVGSYPINASIEPSDVLIVGSENNNANVGGICNFKYYNYPLPLNKIKSIYTKYNKRNPPL